MYKENCRYKVFNMLMACFEYGAGSDTVGISASNNNWVRLFSNVRVQGFFINFIVIGY